MMSALFVLYVSRRRGKRGFAKHLGSGALARSDDVFQHKAIESRGRSGRTVIEKELVPARKFAMKRGCEIYTRDGEAAGSADRAQADRNVGIGAERLADRNAAQPLRVQHAARQRTLDCCVVFERYGVPFSDRPRRGRGVQPSVVPAVRPLIQADVNRFGRSVTIPDSGTEQMKGLVRWVSIARIACKGRLADRRSGAPRACGNVVRE